MQTQWPEWLAQLDADGKSGQQLKSITRGDPYILDLTSTIDFSADTFTGRVRLSPDDTGAALATFTVTVGAFSGGQMNIRYALTAVQTANLPADGDGDALTELVWEFDRETGGGTAKRFAAGNIFISGKVAA